MLWRQIQIASGALIAVQHLVHPGTLLHLASDGRRAATCHLYCNPSAPLRHISHFKDASVTPLLLVYYLRILSITVHRHCAALEAVMSE